MLDVDHGCKFLMKTEKEVAVGNRTAQQTQPGVFNERKKTIEKNEILVSARE